MQISGKVELGFEPVRELFTRSLTSKRDRNAQLCVYVGENRVVDLWATNGAEPFSPDSLVNVFSSGKSIECILLAMLADQGLLNFAERVATYWPEFVGTEKDKDKDRLTVANVMRHEAGLASLNITLSPEQLTASALKQNAVGQVLGSTPCALPELAAHRGNITLLPVAGSPTKFSAEWSPPAEPWASFCATKSVYP